MDKREAINIISALLDLAVSKGIMKNTHEVQTAWTAIQVLKKPDAVPENKSENQNT